MTTEEAAYRLRCTKVLDALRANNIEIKETVWVKGQLHINATFGGTPKTLVVPSKESKS